ncbi:MAG TPA: phosphoribosylamine--glycine ligase [Phycisphaerales bacterium]|nr:phosphoribosylamine--glycine ligase [Phycisphaerales bacterium]
MEATDRINTLLVGAGGREHALALALSQSPRLGTLHISNPENPGLASLGTPVDVPVSKAEIYRLNQYCDKHNIGLVILGPEGPIADGFTDALATDIRLVFAPNAAAARLESDKAWAKQLMRSASIPTAEARVFSRFDRAMDYLQSRDEAPVIKAAGLAAGKGVVLPDSLEAGIEFLRACMEDGRFGDAGRTVLIEERLEGPEVSIHALVDGRNMYILETAQDYKRIGDNDTGPNTGGMGACSPNIHIDERAMETIQREILVPTIDALRREGIDYRGVLYTGLMLTPAGPKVLEYNVRFGDPECQAILARLRTDLIDMCIATCTGRLNSVDIDFSPEPSCCVVLASEGYPESPNIGQPISGIDEAQALQNVQVLHAGTRRDDSGGYITASGRVLNVVATGSTRQDARDLAYHAAKAISFPGMKYRTDIGS